MDTLTLLLLAGIGAIVAGAAFAGSYARPAAALALAYPAVLLAGTKFRERDPTESLAGNVDLQILFELGMSGLVAVLLVGAALRLKPPIRPTWMEAALLGYAVLALASTLWSPLPSLTLVRGAQLVLLLALASLSLRGLGPDGVRRAATWSLVLYVLLFAALAAVVPGARTTHFEYGWEAGGRFSWFAVHPILAGTLAGAAITLVLAELLFVTPARWTRVLGVPLVALLPLLPVVLFAARSRGPIAATLAACTVLILRRWMRPWLAGLVTAVSLALVAGLVLVNAGDALTGWLRRSAFSDNPAIAFLTRGNTPEYLGTLGGRTELWSEVAGLFWERPLFGWGYTASRSVLLELVPWAGYAHNALAQSLLDVGVVGALLLWLVLLVSVFADFLKPTWTGTEAGSARGFAFAGLFFFLVISVLSETFAGAPGYEMLLVLTCILASERTRVPSTG